MYILRLGRDEPIKADVEIMNILTNGELNVAGVSLPVGVLSLLKTTKTAAEIKDLFLEMEEKHDDVLPVIIWDAKDESTQSHFGDMSKGMLEAFIEEWGDVEENNKKKVNSLTVDEVLEKITREGMDSLSEEEMTLLKNASK